MAINAGTVYIDVRPDMKQFNSALASQTKGVTSSFAGMAKSAAAAFGGVFAASKVIGFFGDTITAASNMQESMSKVGVVFGESKDQIVAWSEDSAQSMGLAQQAALESAGTFGNLFTSMDMSVEKSAEMSTSLVQLASDLGSFNNIPIEDALNALRSGLVGEIEPLRRLGVNFNQASLEAEAMRLGLVKGNQELDAAAKAQAAYSLIMQQTTNAQGDFARTSEGFANTVRTLKAEWQDFQVTIGQLVLPVLTWMLQNLPKVTMYVALFATAWAVTQWQSIVLSLMYMKDAIVGVFRALTVGHPILLAVTVAVAVGIAVWESFSGAAEEAREELVRLTQAAIDSKGALDDLNAVRREIATDSRVYSVGKGAMEVSAVTDVTEQLEEFGTVVSTVRAEVYKGNLTLDEAADILNGVMTPAIEATGRTGEKFAKQWAQDIGSATNKVSKLKRAVTSFTELGKQGLREFRESARDNIMGASDALGALSEKAKITSTQLVRAFAKMRRETMQYARNVREVAKLKFMTPETLAQLQEMGPAAMAAFADASKEQQQKIVQDFTATEDGATEAANSIGRVKSEMDALPTHKRIDIDVYYHRHGFEQRAEGGPVAPGVPYTVGERGPEVFVPDRAGYIVPNNARAGGLGGPMRVRITDSNLGLIMDGTLEEEREYRSR